VVFPINRILAESDLAQVVVRGLVVHPAGFEVLSAVASTAVLDRIAGEPGGLFSPWSHYATTPDAQVLKFGVQLADGRQLTNLKELRFDPRSPRLGNRLSEGRLFVSEVARPWLRLACEWKLARLPTASMLVRLDR
jgi:hypothetical protein